MTTIDDNNSMQVERTLLERTVVAIKQVANDFYIRLEYLDSLGVDKLDELTAVAHQIEQLLNQKEQ